MASACALLFLIAVSGAASEEITGPSGTALLALPPLPAIAPPATETPAVRAAATPEPAPAEPAAKAPAPAVAAERVPGDSEAALPEPELFALQEAAAHAAAGSAAEDASRASRARRAHWAPQVRGQAQVHDDEKSRNGEFRLAPLREQDLGLGHVWAVVVAWDFSQLVYAREESQIALANAQLSRARREAAVRAAQLYLERRRARSRWLATPAGADRAEACFAFLRLTAELDALTGGPLREAVSREEETCREEEKR